MNVSTNGNRVRITTQQGDKVRTAKAAAQAAVNGKDPTSLTLPELRLILLVMMQQQGMIGPDGKVNIS